MKLYTLADHILSTYEYSQSDQDISMCFIHDYNEHIMSDHLPLSLSGVPDYFDRNKILSGYDLSHYQVPHCIRVFFYFV